jgi:CheY-like chemotaxis protein
VARILTAVAPDTEKRVRHILDGHDLWFVNDLDAAKSALESHGLDLIFIGARFDESRMFDLLDYIRKDAEHKKIPIVAAMVGRTEMAQATVDGLAHTTKIFGASVFVNLNDIPDHDIGNARLRVIVDTLILPAHHVVVLKDTLSPRT